MADTRQSDIHESIATENERDRWIRLFNRLEAAVSHHKRATGEFATDADEALYAARDRILRDAAVPDLAPDQEAEAVEPGLGLVTEADQAARREALKARP